jgi:drug/metabolite transporter (DMT)-like permease
MGYQQGPQKPDMPGWVRVVGLVFLGLGILLLLGTVVGSIDSEETGMNLAMATIGPLTFGIVTTVMSGKGKKGSAARPLFSGCLLAVILSACVVSFFVSVWPSL